MNIGFSYDITNAGTGAPASTRTARSSSSLASRGAWRRRSTTSTRRRRPRTRCRGRAIPVTAAGRWPPTRRSSATACRPRCRLEEPRRDAASSTRSFRQPCSSSARRCRRRTTDQGPVPGRGRATSASTRPGAVRRSWARCTTPAPATTARRSTGAQNNGPLRPTIFGCAVGAGIKINTPFISPGDYFQTQVNYTVVRPATLR